MAADANVQFCKICKTGRGIKASSDSFKDFKKTLPVGYDYSICEFLSEGEKFKVILRLDLNTEKEAKTWLRSYEASSRTTWRTRSTYPREGKQRTKVVFRLDKGCQHNTRNKVSEPTGRRTKHTDCPATLTIRVQKVVFTNNQKDKRIRVRLSRSNDGHIPSWPTTIVFSWAHNHAVDDPQFLQFRDVSPSVKEKFIKLFQDGHSASSALKLHKEDLAKEHGENYDKIVADRHFCPDLQFCYRLYYNIFRKKTKCISKKKVNQLIQEKITSYNEENGDCILSKVVDDEVVIAIVTPFMSRVHSTVPSAGQVVFMDHSTGDRGSSQLFMMMTDSWAGGLPVGCFITRSDSTQAIIAGLQMVQELVGDGSFYGRGKDGPQLFLTDNLEPERVAISSVYPSSKQLLCIFHVLRSFWQFLFDGQSQVDVQDKIHLFQLMKTLLNAATEADMETHFNLIQINPVVCKYENVFHHFQEIFGQRQLWALCHMDFQELSLTGNTANNFLDAAVLVLKDRLLKQSQVVQTLQVLELVTNKLDTLFRTRMEDLAEGKVTRALTRRYVSIHSLSAYKQDSITQSPPLTFIMSDKKGTHTVDMNVGLCTCQSGISGGTCKHQCALIRLYNIQKWKFSTVPNEATKKWLLYLAQGDLLADLDKFFQRLKEGLSRAPATFTRPVKKFLHQSARCESDSSLAQALLSFKPQGSTSSVFVERQKKRQANHCAESQRNKVARVEESADLEISSQETERSKMEAQQRCQDMDVVPANEPEVSGDPEEETDYVNINVSPVSAGDVSSIQEVTLPHSPEAEDITNNAVSL